MASGTIDRRESGQYRARYRGQDGKQRSKTFTRRGDADRWLRDQLRALDVGRWIDPAGAKIPFAEFADRWLAGKTRIKPRTRASYEEVLGSRILPTFGDVALGVIDRGMVEGWISGLAAEVSPARTRTCHTILSAILERAADDGLIGRNPAKRVELPPASVNERRFLTSAQVRRLAEAMDDEMWETAAYLLAYGGLRWGELVALRRSRVDPLARKVKVAEAAVEVGGKIVFGAPKTHQIRVVQVPRFVADRLGVWLGKVADDPDGLVFTAPGGGPLRYANVRSRVWNPARLRAGADLEAITPHELRHTCASLMRAAGADLKAIQQQLGHRSPVVTLSVYCHLFDGELGDVMDRLEASHDNEMCPERVLGVTRPIRQDNKKAL